MRVDGGCPPATLAAPLLLYFLVQGSRFSPFLGFKIKIRLKTNPKTDDINAKISIWGGRAGAQPRLKSLGGQGMGPNTETLAPRARPKARLGVE